MVHVTRSLAALAWASGLLCGQGLIYSGRVEMEDGSPPPKSAVIERVCGIGRSSVLSRTSRDGTYVVQLAELDPFESLSASRRAGVSMNRCYLRALLSGYTSTRVELDTYSRLGEASLPVLKLSPKLPGQPAEFPDASDRAPKAADKPWKAASLAIRDAKWPEAEAHLLEVTRVAPKFAPAWTLLGVAAQNQGRPADARERFRKAIALDPSSTGPRYLLLKLEIDAADWKAASVAAAPLLDLDKARHFPEARIYDAIARYNLGDLPAAEASARQAGLPRAEFLLARIAEARGDWNGAAGHYRRYLELEPNAADAEAVRDRAARLAAGERVEPDKILAAVNLDLAAQSDLRIPGGIRALAAVSHAEGDLSPARFFETYCRALVRYNTPGAESGIPGYFDSLRAYFTAVSALARMGRQGESPAARVVLSLDASHRAETEQALALLGWRVMGSAGQTRVLPGDLPSHGPSQAIASALGIDEIAMKQALESGRAFEFDILSERVRLQGGETWLEMIQSKRPLPGGLAQAFAEESRLAKAYAGLASLPGHDASAIVAALGARNIVARYADLLLRYGASVRVSRDVVEVPGGPDAAPLWRRLAGADPANSNEFIRAIFDKDLGTMAAFYSTLAACPAARQRFFTTGDHAERAYAWFVKLGVQRTLDLIRDLPLEGTVPDAAAAERLVAIRKFEKLRGRPLDAESTALVERHFADWQPILETLARVPGADLRALAEFTVAARALPPERREQALGAWYTMMELAGDDVNVFRDLCRAAATLELAPALRRIPAAAEALKQTSPEKMIAALTRAVYASKLPPSALLGAEDTGIAARHRWLTAPDGPLFEAAGFSSASRGEGRHFTGGFAGFSALAGKLPPAGTASAAKQEAAVAAPAGLATATAALAGPPPEEVFRTEARLVLLLTTVTDQRGRYVDDLGQRSFEVIEDGRPLAPSGFESFTSGVSCALLLDTTGSMHMALPALKSAALSFIEDLRGVDSVAVYGFSNKVELLQPFTPDKAAAQRAVLRPYAWGETALYDALVRVTRDLESRAGKKVIVLFTDGEDNASGLSEALVLRRIKAEGTPVYTIAQGQALESPRLLKSLAELSAATGGLPFRVQRASDIEPVFARIAQDLAHGYLLSFQPPAEEGPAHEWHRIEVVVKGDKKYKVRTREGYFTH